MEVIITPSSEIAADIVAEAITNMIQAKPTGTLGLATGSSPLLAYQRLIERYQEGQLSFGDVTAFLLDEYVGLAPNHPEAYRSFIQREFTDQVDLPVSRLFGPDGRVSGLESAADRYEAAIRAAGGIDLQLLGVGRDGHIGFNEPSSSLGSRTRLKTLTDTTRTDNKRFFNGQIDEVPRHVLTQGIGTILEAGHLVLVATGDAKAEPVAKMIEGPLTAMVPASALQLHPRATVVVDEAAASQLVLADYYRETYANKPEWQLV